MSRWEEAHRLAVELLQAVEEGTGAGALARELAVGVLRVAPAGTPPWERALAVVEGGALRMRNAVELAGLVLEAVPTSEARRTEST